jgi:hypothetical protein
MNHTTAKHSRLYGLLNKKRMMQQRHDLFQAYSDNRTRDSRDLNDKEVDELIRFLDTYSVGGRQSGYKNDFEKGDKMRKRVLSLCYEYGWVKFSEAKKRHQVDFERLDAWLFKYGYLHKKLNRYKYAELPALVTQFETVLESFVKDL